MSDGNYSNVSSGTTFWDGSVQSVFRPDTDAYQYYTGFTQGRVWQSPFRNWVYESGVVLNNSLGISNRELPIICSGIYAYGVFRPQNPVHPDYDANFAHTIDFINGRIIFDTAQSLDMELHADFSYKHVRVEFEDTFNNQFLRGFLESKYTTNPLTSNQLVYPSGFAYPFPAVFIEAVSRTWEAWELGSRSLVAHDVIRCHIWALDNVTRDNLMDLISYQARKQIPLIDFNFAPLPLSGIFNTVSPMYIPYKNLLANPRIPVPGNSSETSPVIGFNVSINKADPRNIEPAMNQGDIFERGYVDLEFGVYGIAPTTPIGINFQQL